MTDEIVVDKWLSPGDVCSTLGISRTTLANMVRQRQIPPPFRIGDRRTAFSGRALARWQQEKVRRAQMNAQ